MIAGSGPVILHHLFTHTIGLHAPGWKHVAHWERKRVCELIGSVSASHRPQSHSCPLGVSIETETGSTVGAKSMTEDREDPHTK